MHTGTNWKIEPQMSSTILFWDFSERIPEGAWLHPLSAGSEESRRKLRCPLSQVWPHAKPHMWHLSTRNWVISLLFSSNVLYVSSLACMEISLEGVSEHMDNRFGIFKCFQGLGSQWGASKTEAEPWVRITCGAQEGGALGDEPSLGAGHTKKGLGSTIQSLLAGSGAKQSASLPSCLWLCH